MKSDLKNAAVMDAYALRNIMMETDESLFTAGKASESRILEYKRRYLVN